MVDHDVLVDLVRTLKIDFHLRLCARLANNTTCFAQLRVGFCRLFNTCRATKRLKQFSCDFDFSCWAQGRWLRLTLLFDLESFRVVEVAEGAFASAACVDGRRRDFADVCLTVDRCVLLESPLRCFGASEDSAAAD